MILAASAEFPVGYVRVYKYFAETNEWNQIGEDLDSESEDDSFGHSISLSADGSVLASGSYSGGGGRGQVLIFEYNSEADEWIQIGQSIDGVNEDISAFGISVCISADGKKVAVEYFSFQGIVRVYEPVPVSSGGIGIG